MTTLFLLLFRYPWAFVGPYLALGALYGYWRAAPLVAAGRITEAERWRLAVGGAAAILGFALVMSGIQYVSGYPFFICLLVFPPRSVWGTAAWGVEFLAVGGLLWWLWRGRGAETLARVGPAYSRSRKPVLEVQYTSGQVRAVLTTAVLLGTLALPVAMLIVRQPQQTAGWARSCAPEDGGGANGSR